MWPPYTIRSGESQMPLPLFLPEGREADPRGVCTQANTMPVGGVLLWKKTHSQHTEAKTKKKRTTLFRVAHRHVFALTV